MLAAFVLRPAHASACQRATARSPSRTPLPPSNDPSRATSLFQTPIFYSQPHSAEAFAPAAPAGPPSFHVLRARRGETHLHVPPTSPHLSSASPGSGRLPRFLYRCACLVLSTQHHHPLAWASAPSPGAGGRHLASRRPCVRSPAFPNTAALPVQRYPSLSILPVASLPRILLSSASPGRFIAPSSLASWAGCQAARCAGLLSPAGEPRLQHV